VYGWGDGVGDACGANGEAAMYVAANTPEPCSLVDFAHTHHTETHVADELLAARALSSTLCMCVLGMGLRRSSTDDAISALWNGTECDPCHDTMPFQACNTIFISS